MSLLDFELLEGRDSRICLIFVNLCSTYNCIVYMVGKNNSKVVLANLLHFRQSCELIEIPSGTCVGSMSSLKNYSRQELS